jgi:hypothetical protein
MKAANASTVPRVSTSAVRCGCRGRRRSPSLACASPSFRAHFAVWDRVARHFYEFEERAACPLDVRIGFRKSGRARPHGLGIEIAISGECEFGDVVGGRRSLVTIEVAVSELNWASMAAIPSLLMHELVCHAYQGCWVSCPRQLPEDACAFAASF